MVNIDKYDSDNKKPVGGLQSFLNRSTCLISIIIEASAFKFSWRVNQYFNNRVKMSKNSWFLNLYEMLSCLGDIGADIGVFRLLTWFDVG